MVRIAKKTIELTIHVAPKSKRHVHDALRLQQHEARRPGKTSGRWAGRGARGEGEKDQQREHRHERHSAQVEGRDRRLAEVKERPVVGRNSVDPRQLRPRPARA